MRARAALPALVGYALIRGLTSTLLFGAVNGRDSRELVERDAARSGAGLLAPEHRDALSTRSDLSGPRSRRASRLPPAVANPSLDLRERDCVEERNPHVEEGRGT